MKKIFLKIAAVLLLAATALCGAAGCKGDPSLEGAYKLSASEEHKRSWVLFELSDPSMPIGSGLSETTAYLRLVSVHLKIRKVDSGTGSVNLELERCVDTTGRVDVYRGKAEDRTSVYGKWYEPFDLSRTHASNLTLNTYKYYRLSVTGGDLYLGEIVFVGEILDKEDGVGTGQYCIVPVKIHTATTQGGETQERANQRAKALIDDQPQSVTEIIK